MKKLKLLFNVSEAALTAAVFVLVTALVPMDIILKLVSQSVINGNPCLYDALISVNVSTMWRYVVPFVLFYVLYIQKYDLNSAIVIRRKNVRNVWINSQINMVVAAGFFSAYITVVTLTAGYLMTGKVYNWDEKFSKRFTEILEQSYDAPDRYSTEPPITVAFYNCICYRSICNTVCIRHAYDDYVVAY